MEDEKAAEEYEENLTKFYLTQEAINTELRDVKEVLVGIQHRLQLSTSALRQ